MLENRVVLKPVIHRYLSKIASSIPMVVSAAVAPGLRTARLAWRLSANVKGAHRIISKGNAGWRSRQPSLRKLPTQPRAIAEADKPSTGNSTGSNISIEIDNTTESKETLITIQGANRAGEERNPHTKRSGTRDRISVTFVGFYFLSYACDYVPILSTKCYL